MITDADAAALYDLTNPWESDRHPGDAFYTGLVMATRDVLDVGCGTGQLLHEARAKGHTGRLTGLDPDAAALDRARRRTDVEWVHAVAADARWDGEFDLATMTSCAFQCLVTDEDLRASLKAISNALRARGRFAFETRHPQAEAWRDWTPENASEVEFGDRTLRIAHQVEDVTNDVVTFTETTSEDGEIVRVDRATLRFLDVPTLNGFLEPEFEIEDQFGDWQKGPVTEASRLILTVARRRP